MSAGPEASGRTFDVAIVQATEVSQSGDLVAGPVDLGTGWDARRWIAVGLLGDEPALSIVRTCRFPVTRNSCVDLIITDMGVIRVGKVGLELIELAPGFSSDDVRRRIRASIHVADGIGRIKVAV